MQFLQSQTSEAPTAYLLLSLSSLFHMAHDTVLLETRKSCFCNRTFEVESPECKGKRFCLVSD